MTQECVNHNGGEQPIFYLTEIIILVMKFTLLKWEEFSQNYVTILSNESNYTAIFHSSKQISTLESQEVKYMKDSLIKREQLDVTCFIISLFNAQHISDVNTSILRSLRLIC